MPERQGDKGEEAEETEKGGAEGRSRAKQGKGETRKMKMRRSEWHDEGGPTKRIKLREVIPEDAEIGIAWLEHYILYIVHGGWSREREDKEETC